MSTRSTHAGDGFRWPTGTEELPLRGPDRLPEPLWEFLDRPGATVLARRHELDRPLVVAVGDRVVKAYDLGSLEPVDRARTLVEAEIAETMASVPGVVTTHRVGTVGTWVVIELERMDLSMAAQLAAARAGEEPPLTPERWGALLAKTASTLGALHRRGIVHRDLKPDNLLLDAERSRLLVADFSISLRGRRRRARRDDREDGVLGTSGYVAPEQFDGNTSPAADQYALGITAAEALGEAADRVAVRDVLLRATARDPAERFGSIDEFGTALRAALDDHAPHRVSARLARVSARWRVTWGPSACFAIACYGLATLARRTEVGWRTGPLVLVSAFAIGAAAMRAFGRLRRERTRPRVRFADQPWFAPALFAFVVLAILPILQELRDKAAMYSLGAVVAALAITSFLGSTPPDAGMAFVRLVRRWERWREPHRERPVRWWLGRAPLVGAVALVAWVPVAVEGRWPRAPLGPAGPPLAVADFRGALLEGDLAGACELIRVSASSGRVPCKRWAPLARRWLRAELRDRRVHPFTPAQMDEVRFRAVPDRDAFEQRPLTLRAGSDDRVVGWMDALAERDGVWLVELPRRPAADGRGPDVDASWRYESVERRGRWWITSVEACDFTAGGPGCTQLTQLRRSRLLALERARPPVSG